MANVAVIGATVWGSTLGKLLADKGIAVTVWARNEPKAVELRQEQRRRSLKVGLSSRPYFTSNVDEALHSAEFVIWAVPAQSLRQNVRQVRDYLTASMIQVSVAKGLEMDTGKRMSEVIVEEAAVALPERVCALSGPNLAKEINKGLPATSVIAGKDVEVTKKVQRLLDSANFAVFASDDIIGVELCGALKNIIALGAGMIDGLGLGNNAKAAFITMGWAEAVSLGVALGARETTFYGLAGLGDLIATCQSPLSRNHYVGCELGKGRSLSEITASMSNIAEGVDTAMAAHHLISRSGLEVPIIDLIYRALFESLSPIEVLARFKSGLKPEAAI